MSHNFRKSLRKDVARILVLICSLVMSLTCIFPVAAHAQSPVSECGAERGSFTLVPASGQAGSAFSLSGSVMLLPTVNHAEASAQPDPSITMPGPDFEVWWVESDMAGATLLGIIPSTFDDVTQLASFGGGFMVPATSVPGQHQVAVMIVGSQVPACEDFTVTTAVQEDAYVQTAASLPASLPGTGLMLISPLAGFLAVAAGSYAIRNRKPGA